MVKYRKRSNIETGQLSRGWRVSEGLAFAGRSVPLSAHHGVWVPPERKVDMTTLERYVDRATLERNVDRTTRERDVDTATLAGREQGGDGSALAPLRCGHQVCFCAN